MFLTYGKGIRGGMCQVTCNHAEANSKYMKNYDKNKESSFLMYVDANNLYGWAMTKTLPVDSFKWVDDLSMFFEDFIKSYDEESDIGYLLVVDVEYPKTLRMLHSKSYRDIRFITTEARRNKLASEPNYQSIKCISKHLLVMEMKKTEVKMNKPIYLGQAVLDITKTLMFEFWYDYLKPMYDDKIRLCYIDTDIFIMHIKTDDFYKDISADVDKWFDTSNFNKNDNRPLEIGKNKKVLGKVKDETGGKIMTKFAALRAKTYSFLIGEYKDDDYEKNKRINKKTKGTKTCVIKRERERERERSYLIIILIHC